MKIITKAMVSAIAVLLIAVLVVAPASAEDNPVISSPTLNEGWNTLSTPIYLKDAALGDVISNFDSNVEIAYRWNSQTMNWVQMLSTGQLETLDAIFVKATNNSVGTTFVVSSDLTPPPSRDLAAGWNFVSLANLDKMKAEYALDVVSDEIKIVSSPYGNRAEIWSLSWNDPAAKAKNLYPGEGYWIFMKESGVIAGFTSTPLSPGQQYTLTMSVNGEGTVAPAVGVHTYNEGTVVTMTATPADGWEFDEWQLGGVFYSADASTTITMDADKSVTAVFTEIQQYTLTMAVNGEGNVNPAVGSHAYDEGTVVTMTATPADGWEFDEWQLGGVFYSADASTTITMDADKSVTAVFLEEGGMRAEGTITVGAMNFNEVLVSDVANVPGAAKFSVEDSPSIKAIGGDTVTFMASGSTTLQIYDAADNLLATGTLTIPAEVGAHAFTVNLVEVPPVEKKATGTITVGAMNFNDLQINGVTGIASATQFSVTEVATLRTIGGDSPVTFMGAGSTTLQIYDDASTLLATGTLTIPGTFGEHAVEVDLTLV